jgi:hypothetical protein
MRRSGVRAATARRKNYFLLRFPNPLDGMHWFKVAYETSSGYLGDSFQNCLRAWFGPQLEEHRKAAGVATFLKRRLAI